MKKRVNNTHNDDLHLPMLSAPQTMKTPCPQQESKVPQLPINVREKQERNFFLPMDSVGKTNKETRVNCAPTVMPRLPLHQCYKEKNNMSVNVDSLKQNPSFSRKDKGGPLESSIEPLGTQTRLEVMFVGDINKTKLRSYSTHNKGENVISSLQKGLNGVSGEEYIGDSLGEELENRLRGGRQRKGTLCPVLETPNTPLDQITDETFSSSSLQAQARVDMTSFTDSERSPKGHLEILLPQQPCDAFYNTTSVNKDISTLPFNICRKINSSSGTLPLSRVTGKGSTSSTIDARVGVRRTRKKSVYKVQGRRLKKDAESLYSVILPTFDDTTGMLGDNLVFPQSLSVDVAIQSVIRQERGEMRIKAGGVGITRFLSEFQESHEIIYLYFWYIVAHIRRVSTENMLIGRYGNLERVIRGAFPRYKADLPPIDELENILTKISYAAKKITQDSSVSSPREVDGHESLSAFIFGLSGPSLGGRCNSFSTNISTNVEKSHSSHTTTRLRKKRHWDHSFFKNITMNIDHAAEHLLIQNPTLVKRCTEAIDAFKLVLDELYELSDFLRCCFQRLAMLFSQAAERLTSEKDSILESFNFIVPHVTYYAMVYCFPNDVFAGLFNASMRLNLYRIFYFWSSGLMATYVRTSGWPIPYHAMKRNTITSSDKKTTNVVSSEMLHDNLHRSSMEINNEHFALEEDSMNIPNTFQFQGNSLYPVHSDVTNEEGLQEMEESLDNVDIEVVNGHHRLVQEFQKYASHVKHLVQELEQRTTEMHRVETWTTPTTAISPQKATGDMMVTNSGKENRGVVSIHTDSISPLSGRKKQEEQRNPIVLNSGANSSSSKNPHDRSLSVIYDIINPITKPHQNLSNNIHNDNNKYGNSHSILPTISTQSENIKSTKISTSHSECILSVFPLKLAAKNVRHYIMRQTGKLLTHIPLPPLDNDSISSNSVHNKVIHSIVRGKLPLASPFFLHYTKRLSYLKADKSEEMSVSRLVKKGKSSSSTTSVVVTPESSVSFADTSSQMTEISHQRLPLFKGLNLSGTRNGGGKNKPLPLPHSTEKAINIMLIAPCDTQLRPLQFKNFTKEVKKRQLVHERQMDQVAEREQRLRQQYNAENQYGIRCVNKLLTECQQDRLETEALRGLVRNKPKKRQAANRRKERISTQEIKN